MKNWDKLEADVNMILDRHFSKGRGRYRINKIVEHYNAGNLSVAGCYSVWQSREASAHYQVEDDGYIGQLVWDGDTAWHCGKFSQNQQSIGIEHANGPDGTVTEATLDAGAHLTAAVCKYFGLGRPEWLRNVFPHKYFKPTACPGQIYGSQRDAYIVRAQEWYDYMVGEGDAPVNGDGSPKPVSQALELGDRRWWGPRYCKATQKQVGTYVDGYLEGQPSRNKRYFWAVDGGVRYGSHGSNCIRQVQRGLIALGYSVGKDGADGKYGPNTIRAVQRWLVDNGISVGKSGIDGKHGNDTNRAWGTALDRGLFRLLA